MGQQKSLIKIKGTLDDLTFYKSQDGHMVRMKGGVDGERIKNDPRFARTRENMSEFTEMNQKGKWIRSGFRTLIGNSSDGRASSRLSKVLSTVLKEDKTSLRGERKVGIGLATTEGKAFLADFNFNDKAILTEIFKSNYSIDPPSGKIEITGFNPSLDLSLPIGATHCAFQCAWINIDFEAGETISSLSNNSVIDLSTNTANIVLSPTQPPSGSGILMIALKISFLQSLNGRQYPLQNEANNAIQIVHIA